MSAFANALAALHQDPNLSVACSWAYGWSRDAPRTLVADLVAGTYSLSIEPVALRGVRWQPQEQTFGGPSLGAVTSRQRLDIAAADLPADVMRGDLVGIGAESYAVEMPERDVEALTWRCTLGKP
jgi:hypothetical protein